MHVLIDIFIDSWKEKYRQHNIYIVFSLIVEQIDINMSMYRIWRSLYVTILLIIDKKKNSQEINERYEGNNSVLF